MRWTWDAFLFIVIVVGAFVSLGYAWKKWHSDTTKAETPGWRRAFAALGFIVVSCQVALFTASWTRVGRDYVMFRQWSRLVLPVFLVGLPFILAGKAPSRWWLLSSSILFFIVCFFIALSA
jgi:hypothetical protein